MSKGVLGQRIEELEKRLSHASGGSCSATSGHRQTPTPNRGIACQKPDSDDCSTHEGSRLMPQRKRTSSDEVFLGPSSGLVLAEHLNELVPDTEADSQALPIVACRQDHDPPRSGSAALGKDVLPDDATGITLLRAYFENFHLRLPFLDRADVIGLHSRGRQLGSQEADQAGKQKILTVYAIGSRILHLDERMAVEFLAQAPKIDPTSGEVSLISAIEATMLEVVYKLRSTINSSVWYGVGLAMRICIDVGLHREKHYRKLGPFESQMHRRLFWSTYLLERYVASSLGRPFSIAEEDIDTELPHDLDESIMDEHVIAEALRDDSARELPDKATNLNRFITSIRLQRITSRIQSRIYRNSKDLAVLQGEIAPMLASLQEFHQKLPDFSQEDYTWVKMHWSNTIRMLLQPFLTNSTLADIYVADCMHASGQVCQLFKTMRQRHWGGYGILLANSVFMSGLTIWSEFVPLLTSYRLIGRSYCLSRSPQLWTVAVANDIRACSASLFIVAERNPSFRSCRDYFETVANAVTKHVDDKSYKSPMCRGQHEQSNCSQPVQPVSNNHVQDIDHSRHLQGSLFQAGVSHLSQNGQRAMTHDNEPHLFPNLGDCIPSRAEFSPQYLEDVCTEQLRSESALDLPMLEDFFSFQLYESC